MRSHETVWRFIKKSSINHCLRKKLLARKIKKNKHVDHDLKKNNNTTSKKDCENKKIKYSLFEIKDPYFRKGEGTFSTSMAKITKSAFSLERSAGNLRN